jgi:hypothetical protein
MAKVKDKNKSMRNVELDNSDIAIIATFALTSKNISFKKHCEKLLANEAKNIKKNKRSLVIE